MGMVEPGESFRRLEELIGPPKDNLLDVVVLGGGQAGLLATPNRFDYCQCLVQISD
jgi:hypothetical protein